MILDNNALFSSHQAITTTAGSTSILDTTTTADVGPGTIQRLFAVVGGTAFTTLTSLTIALQTDASSNFGTALTLWQSSAFASAALGANVKIPLPGLIQGCLRWLRLKYTVSGTAATGDITAGLIVDDQSNTSPPGSP
jgi:hypothetical protein